MEQRFSDNETSRRDIPSFIEPRPPLIQNPFMRPRPQKGLNLLEQFEEDSDIEETELVQVYLRMKPCDVASNLYEVRSDKSLVTSLDTTTAGHGRRTQHNVSRMYTFSRIFTAESKQKEVFEQVVKENLKKLPDGHSFTLLTYGASGSGKTYTLMGTVSSPGLVPRSLEYLFKLVDAAQMPTYKPSDNGVDHISLAQQESELKWVKRLRHLSAPLRDKYRRMSAQLHGDLTTSNMDLSNRTKHYIWVSFVEIYNEAIYDLLAPLDKRTKLRIREDTSGNVYVKGVTQAFVRSGEEAYDVMVAGKHNLVVAATGIHAHSSRSHCIFTITLLTENEGGVAAAHVRLCDLAGSERQRAARNTGARMQESRAINFSLHVLERCLHTLRRKQKQDQPSSMVPYRESKLTRLLGSGLSGSRGEAVSMVVTLNPSPLYAHETKHVLSLAAVAQDIQINNSMYASTLSSLESSTQDSTICSNAEVMKLRAENERLHFELIQAQARNAELLSSMEETQQKTASSMQELFQETKDMMRQFYEAQIKALKTEMDDMAEAYESRLAESREAENALAENRLAESILAKSPMPAGSGTPLRYLQSKVEKLMTKKTVLEDQLSEEKLARTLAEEEVQYLHNCIEERDEKAFKETSPEHQQEIIFIDSDQESDDETDPFNESLEPVFKIERANRSRIFHKEQEPESVKKKDNITEEIEDNLEKECDNDEGKTNDTLRDTNDSLYATGDDDSEILHEKLVENVTNLIQANNDEKDAVIDTSIVEADVSVMNDTNAEKDKSECEELFLESTKLHDEVQNLIPSTPEGTYFVNTNDLQKGILKNDTKIRNINPVRGTYFVEEPVYNVNVDANTKEKEVATKLDKPKVSETVVSNIVKSLKTSHGNDSSLKQFEQLEMAANNIDNSKDKSSDFVNLKILKEKRTYFDEIIYENSNKTALPKKPTTIDQLPDNVSNETASEALTIDEKLAKSEYFIINKNDEDDLCKLSNEVKEKEKLLSYISHEHIFETLTVAKKQDKPSNNDKNDVIDPSVEILETHLYFDVSDKAISNDVLISRSGAEKRHSPYFDNIGANVGSATNKKVDDVMIHSVKDYERSPSIVADDIEKDYVPSEAIKKLLRESFSKPDLSSIRKRKPKQQASVDIFDSPQINIAKGDIIEEEKNKETVENIEIGVPKAKELSNVEVIRKSIERLVLEQKSRTDCKQDSKLAPIEEPVTKNVTKEQVQNQIDIQVSSEQEHNDTQFSKENNTIEIFEDIYKDLSKVRATEFELLVSEDINTKDKADEQEIEQASNSKVNNKPENSESTNNFEETKYNLRNKDKSNVGGKKGNDVEVILAQSHSKCESKTTKKRLRLRRKPQDDGSSEDTESKLKDIINLKNEFCDVTMGLPAVRKEVKDIQSPERMPEEEENHRPVMGVQSCPMKSVTRSRRKLFTPRAEPLEESLNQAGDSNERLYVPRPSYHRTRARRKL